MPPIKKIKLITMSGEMVSRYAAKEEAWRRYDLGYEYELSSVKSMGYRRGHILVRLADEGETPELEKPRQLVYAIPRRKKVTVLSQTQIRQAAAEKKEEEQTGVKNIGRLAYAEMQYEKYLESKKLHPAATKELEKSLDRQWKEHLWSLGSKLFEPPKGTQ